jgi:hypothetical protein
MTTKQMGNMDNISPITQRTDPPQTEEWMDSPLTNLQKQWTATNSKYQLVALVFAVITMAVTIAIWAGAAHLLDPALTLPLVSKNSISVNALKPHTSIAY